MASGIAVQWVIRNKLINRILEVSHFQLGNQPQFENLPSGQTKKYQSSGKDGRIALRVQRPNGFRVEFGENDFTGWIEIDPKDQSFNTLIFPNGEENDNGDKEKNVTIFPPE